MLVLKFGGTSIGSVKQMSYVKDIISNNHEKKIVVLSAMSGTTNKLVHISESIKQRKTKQAILFTDKLYSEYQNTAKTLLKSSETKEQAYQYIQTRFNILYQLIKEKFSEINHNRILAQGEMLSSFLFNIYLNEKGINSTLISALDFMRIDKSNEPDEFYIKQNLNRILSQHTNTNIYITQGFICLDANGNISNLQRGGSDYTASIIGAAIEAKEVQIWTDIDGFHNNDPRYVDNTKAISNLSFNEAAELAYFGAKILHPQTVMPIRKLNIPLRLKNTMNPKAKGTLITNTIHGEGIKAIAAKDGITAIKIKSGRMLLAYGFLKRVFEIFEKYKTAIDMVTTSEIAISLTIDNTINLTKIIEELETFASVEVDEYRTIVALVGNNIVFHPDTPKLFQILHDVNVRMIAYGGSNNNISLLINTSDKKETLQKLNRYVFEPENGLVFN